MAIRSARASRAGSALLLLLAACAGERGGTRGGDADEATPPGPAAAVELRALSPATPPFRPDQERGVGVLHLPGEAPDAPPGPYGSDTLTVRASPSASAPVVARLYGDGGTWHLEAAPPAAAGAAVAFGYEEVGLPVLEARGDGWVRALYATDEDGGALAGWARRGGVARLLDWSDLLPERPLWFLDEPAFHDARGGARRSIPLEAGDGAGPTPGADYILWPLEARGPWLRVEVVTPSDYCFDPAAPRRDTAWIRYLDETRRPRTWFYTRGC